VLGTVLGKKGSACIFHRVEAEICLSKAIRAQCVVGGSTSSSLTEVIFVDEAYYN
jgi:hypothetical protein